MWPLLTGRLPNTISSAQRSPFERLSELGHPNYHGMMATFTVEKADPRKAFCDRRNTTIRPLMLTAFGTLATNTSVIIRCFEMLARDLEALAVLPSARSAHLFIGRRSPRIDQPDRVRRSCVARIDNATGAPSSD